jgi:hypothetical protein
MTLALGRAMESDPKPPPIVEEYKLQRLRSARTRWRGFGLFTWVVSVGMGVFFVLTPASTPRELIGQDHALARVSPVLCVILVPTLVMQVHRMTHEAWDHAVGRALELVVPTGSDPPPPPKSDDSSSRA